MRALLVLTPLLAAALLASLATACHPEDIDAMERQPKLLPYAASDISPRGQAMRAPPPGAVPRERDLGETQPEVTPALMALGRARFDMVCALCHGVAGDGDSIIGGKMGQRPPPSLHEPQIRALAATDLYRVVTDGYGVMPRYATHLSPRERWAVVAYVRALQQSQNTAIADVPEAARRALQESP